MKFRCTANLTTLRITRRTREAYLINGTVALSEVVTKLEITVPKTVYDFANKVISECKRTWNHIKRYGLLPKLAYA